MAAANKRVTFGAASQAGELRRRTVQPISTTTACHSLQFVHAAKLSNSNDKTNFYISIAPYFDKLHR